MSLREKGAITGVGETAFSRESRRSVLSLQWTVTHHAFQAEVREDLPYTLATVYLEEGVRMNAQLRGVPAEKLRIGLHMRVAFETVKDGLTLPYLTPGEPA